MNEKKAGLKTIWYFVGLVLLTMGGLVLLSGVIQIFVTPENPPVLAELRPSLWWGSLMVIIGFIYYITNKNKIVD